jgi:O-antigen/teichoic acid export membrane protein/pSer/pThr/pTyr-binding forkhead associated (FHA) protein
MSKHSLDLFLTACGAVGPLELTVRGPAGHKPGRWVLHQPFALIGRRPGADVFLPDGEVSPCHLYLQMLGGCVFWIDLRGEAAPGSELNRRRCGWLAPGEARAIGGVRVRLARQHPAPEAVEGSAGGPPPAGPFAAHLWPSLRLERPYSPTAPVPLRAGRPLTLIGRAAGCNIRLRGPRVSRVHCSLVKSPVGTWVVDFCTPQGVRVNGARVRVALLEQGDQLQVGEFRMRVGYDPPDDGPPPAVEGLAFAGRAFEDVGRDDGASPAAAGALALKQRRLFDQFRQSLSATVQGFESFQEVDDSAGRGPEVQGSVAEVILHSGEQNGHCNGSPLAAPPPPGEPAPAESAAAPGSVPTDGAAAGIEPGMKKAVARGAAWILFSYGVMLVLRFGSNLILTWLLAPRLLGVMALVNLFMQGLDNFSDLGLRQCVVQSPRGDDPAFLQTAWTLQICRGLLLWFCSGLIACPLSWFYGEPALLWLIPTVGATAALTGLSSTSVCTLSRRLLRGRLVLLEVGAYATSMAVVIGTIWQLSRHWPADAGDGALQTYQLMALAAGSLCSGLFQMVVSYLILPGFKHRLHLDRQARAQLLRFGGWVFVSTACTFLAAQADRLVVGKISLDALGVYNVAAQLAAIPILLMITLGSQLVFPLYSRSLRAGQDLRSVFARVHPLFAGFAALLATGLASAGPTLIHGLYKANYADAGWYIRLLAASAWLTMAQGTRELTLLARGRTRALALGQGLRLLALPPLLLAGYAAAGITGVILGFAAAELLRYALNVWLTRGLGLSALAYDLVLPLLIVAVNFTDSRLGPALWGGAPHFLQFVFDGAFVTAVWGAAFLAWRSRGGALGARLRRLLPEGVRP